jgi:hypothetical protein
MLYQRILKDGSRLTEDDLRAMAKQAYDELLVELCTSQRSTPYEAGMHSASNLALMDYYQRLAFQGGRMSFLPAEEQQLVQAGWEAQRIADLRTIIQMIEDGHETKLNQGYIESLLLRHGFAPDVRTRSMTELALYPAFRDAHIDAEVELQRMISPVAVAREAENAVVQVANVETTPTLQPQTLAACPTSQKMRSRISRQTRSGTRIRGGRPGAL